MSSVESALRSAVSDPTPIRVDGAPEANLHLAPRTVDEVAQVLAMASEHRLRVLLWGGGTHQGIGGRLEPDLVLSTGRLDRIAAWEPDDLTLIVEAGVRAEEVEARLAERNQTAVLPELAGSATVGGVVAAGISGWRRLRFGPTRDRVLEVVLITGDGRIVRGGGRVVKNVTGYDLPRLATGSLGSLGVIAQVGLKLWPTPHATATVEVEDAERAEGLVYRPLAVIEDAQGGKVFLGGEQAEVEARVEALGGSAREGLRWPSDLDTEVRLSLRIPPRLLAASRTRIPTGWAYQIEHGVGNVRLGTSSTQIDQAAELRGWAESVGGALVVTTAPPSWYSTFDPWGRPPPSLALQRRLVARFDPARVLNPGRLPGGL